MHRRYRGITRSRSSLAMWCACTLLVLAACGADDSAVPVDMPDWPTLIEATRAIQPSQTSVEMLVERNEEPVGGTAITSVGDWNSMLADLGLFEPLNNTPLARIVMNANTSWVLGSADAFNDALPDGVEIVRMPTSTLVDGRVIPATAAELTAPLDLLRGAESAAERGDGTIEVTLRVEDAMAELDPAAAEMLGLSLEGVENATAVADVTLSADATAIRTFRVRIEGSLLGDEWLVTGVVDVLAVDTELDFEPPDEALVVDLSEVPEIEPLLQR